MRLFSSACLVAWLATSAGCSPKPPSVRPIDRGPGPDAIRDPLGAALHADVRRRAGFMEETGTTRRGRLADDGSAELSFVLQAGYCFAVIARSEDSAGELRLRILDSNHDPRQVDRETGASATIGFDDPLCPEPSTEFRLELRAERAADYAVRLFRAPAI